MKRILFAAVAALLAGAAAAEPIEIKGFTLGADLHEEAAKAAIQCTPSRVKTLSAETCVKLYPSGNLRTFAGADVTSLILFGYEGKLGSIYITFPQASFNVVRDAIREKFQDLKCTDSVVQNKLGASFDQTECVYHSGEGDEVLLDRRSSDLGKGRFGVSNKQYNDQYDADKQRQAAKAKKDL